MRQRSFNLQSAVCDSGVRPSLAPDHRSSKCKSRRWLFSAIFLTLFLSGSVLWAQDKEETPLNLGGFNTQGSVTVGYRFEDVKGYRPMFQELSGLNKGFRLMDFNVFGEAAKGKNLFADSYSLSLSGLGGEPFEMGQIAVRKNRLYDFRANWRQSYFYSNRNDNLILPIAAVGT